MSDLPREARASHSGGGTSEPPPVFPAPRSRHLLRAGSLAIPLGETTLVMGILNCTPDSFSDGGLFAAREAAIRRLHEIEEEGADWIDVGGESTRPGAENVSADEEWRRVGPVLEEARRSGVALPISIDTTKAEVARRAFEAGVVLLNDVSALRSDPALGALAARHRAGVVLMHRRGDPKTMQEDPRYEDVTREVGEFLGDAARRAEGYGIDPDRILVDPGIGFGKTAAHNLELLRRLPELAACGHPILIGASRKSFLGRVLNLPVDSRLEASLAAHVAAALAGAHVIRAHDVRATVRAVRVADAIRRGL